MKCKYILKYREWSFAATGSEIENNYNEVRVGSEIGQEAFMAADDAAALREARKIRDRRFFSYRDKDYPCELLSLREERMVDISSLQPARAA